MKQIDKTIAPALQYGLAILELLQEKRACSFNEITAFLGVSKSTTSRLLKIMADWEYVLRNSETGKYQEGLKLVSWGKSTFLDELIFAHSEEIIRGIIAESENSALILTFNGKYLKWLKSETHPSSVPLRPQGTALTDLSQNPGGWVFYFHLNPDQQQDCQKYFINKDFFKRRVSDWQRFYETNGFCFDDQEMSKHLRRFAAPVFGPGNKVVAAIGIGGNPLTIPDEMIMPTGELLKAKAEKLSEILKDKI